MLHSAKPRGASSSFDPCLVHEQLSRFVEHVIAMSVGRMDIDRVGVDHVPWVRRRRKLIAHWLMMIGDLQLRVINAI
jgi:hypothetical protein